MSEYSSLIELARFVGNAELDKAAGAARDKVVNDASWRTGQRPSRQRVTDLLSVVLTLSARTRRLVMPRVEVDIDVFNPSGARAVRMRLPS
jgi:hypothetical protein